MVRRDEPNAMASHCCLLLRSVEGQMAGRVVFDDGRRTLRDEGDQAGLIYAKGGRQA